MSRTIRDIAAEIGSGITPLRSKIEYWNSKDIPWVKTEQLGEYQIFEANEYISKTALEKESIKLWPKKTVSIAMYGEGKTRGNVSILMMPSTTNQACCNIVVDSEKADYRFLYYWIKNNYEQLRTLAAGVRKNLNSDDIKGFPFPDFDVPAQACIADVLSAIDDLIQNNSLVCTELEAMAKTLYDYWFTQFDFPNADGKPYRSSGGETVWNEQLKREIPKGWEVTTMSALTTVLTGKEDANFSTPDGKYKFFTCAQETLLCDTPTFSGHAVLIAGNGDFNVKHYTGSFNAYQRTYVLIPNEAKHYAIMYIAAQKRIQAFKQGSNGSIVKFITKGDVENIPIILPDNDTLLETLNEILKKIEQCERENDELTKLRNWLLPMLMNGQATVSGLATK